MSHLALRLSPRGRRAGIALAGDGRQQVAIAILPKLWADRSTVISRRWEGPSLLVVGHELDTVRIEASPQKLAIIERLVQHSADAASSRDRSPLVEQVVARTSTPERERHSRGAVVDLLRLKSRLSIGTAGAAPDRRLLGKTSTAWLLRPLVCIDFVSELERLIGTLRRGYQPVVELLGAVRGRIDPRSLITYKRTGIPRLVCEYDAFTRETPLARALTSALEVVASGSAGGGLQGDPVLAQVPERALALRRAMSDVRSFGRREAIRVLSTSKPDRLNRSLTKACALAQLILRGEGYEPSASAADDFPAFEVDVPTDEAWEHILERALKSHPDPEQVQAQNKYPPPWEGGNAEHAKPDLMLRLDGVVWCADAKYKQAPGRKGPAGSDLYQIFAYSHLASSKAEPIERCALVYPGRGDPARRIARYTRNPSDAASPTLDTVVAPYPAPKDVATSRAWRLYLERAGRLLVDALSDKDRKEPVVSQGEDLSGSQIGPEVAGDPA